ncbi:MAG: hypothetical protein ACLFV7_02405 [Phycisphaerae bacterium]
MKLDKHFRDAVDYVDFSAIEASADVTFFLDDRLCLCGWNQAYDRFAIENDGADVLVRFPLGFSLPEVIDPSIRSFYVDGFQQAVQTASVFGHEYECSTPEKFRLFYQTAYPLLRQRGLVVTNHQRLEASFAQDMEQQFDARHVRADGSIVQCCHCRKIQDQNRPEKWDWIPQLVRIPHPDREQGLCAACFEHYYPQPLQP